MPEFGLRMEDLEFSDQFCRFLQAMVPAVDAAELLLLFHRKPDDWLGAQEAVQKLGPGINLGDAQKYLAAFGERGLLEREGERFRYRRASEFASSVDTLWQAYTQRPVTLIRVIYALRDSRIKSFADAFRLRKN
jgi:hypothetical protein